MDRCITFYHGSETYRLNKVWFCLKVECVLDISYLCPIVSVSAKRVDRSTLRLREDAIYKSHTVLVSSFSTYYWKWQWQFKNGPSSSLLHLTVYKKAWPHYKYDFKDRACSLVILCLAVKCIVSVYLTWNFVDELTGWLDVALGNLLRAKCTVHKTTVYSYYDRYWPSWLPKLSWNTSKPLKAIICST